MAVTLTLSELSAIKVHCIKDGNIELLDKILEIEDWCLFHHQWEGITIGIDWRSDREAESKEPDTVV